MRELLERWRSLEPERCGISEHAAHLGKPFAFRIHWAVLTADPINLAVILAAVIEAIEARGWLWRYDSSLKWACVWGQGIRGEKNRRGGDLPAALLGAYLAALEAERSEQ